MARWTSRPLPVLLSLALLVSACGKPEGQGSASPEAAAPAGLRWEVLREGVGDPPRPDQGVRIRYECRTPEGLIVVTSRELGPLAGPVATLRLQDVPLPFLPGAVARMRPGGLYRATVPPAEGFGSSAPRGVDPRRPTVWELELERVNDIPAFRVPDPARTLTTPSGLAYEVVKEGTGQAPASRRAKVTVHYTGWLEDGTLFDSSHARGETVEFPLDGVIAGWTEGVGLMREGSTVLLRIPAPLAYGSRPPPGSGIPPDANLIFLVQLIRTR